MLQLTEDPEKASAAVTFIDTTLVASDVSDSVRVGKYDKLFLTVFVSLVSGTTPSLVIDIEVSGNSAEWAHRHTVIDTATQGSLTRLTVPTTEGKIKAAGTFMALVDGLVGDFVRLKWTITGTSPSFRVTARGYFK